MKLFQRHLAALAALTALLAPACVTSALEERGIDGDEYAMREELADPSILARRDLNVGIVMAGDTDAGAETAKRIFSGTKDHADPGMTVFTIGGEGADYSMADAPRRIDVLVTAGQGGSDSVTSFVKDRGERADYIMSLGTGAYLLASAGLLDGTHATSSPADRQTIANRHPKIIMHESKSFVHDGKAVTSVGGDEAQNAALYLCEHLYGSQAAYAIATDLDLEWNPARVSSLIPREQPVDPDRRVGDAVDRAQAEGSRLLPR